MTAIYGHKWASAYGETDADDTWARGLHDVSPQQLAAGLHACLARTDPWPPTLPEFIALCKPEPKPAYHDEYPSLPAPKLTDEQLLAIEADMAALRKAARKATQEFELELARKRNPLPESPDPQEAAL